MGRNAKRRRTLAAQSRQRGYAGAPDPLGPRALRRQGRHLPGTCLPLCEECQVRLELTHQRTPDELQVQPD